MSDTPRTDAAKVYADCDDSSLEIYIKAWDGDAIHDGDIVPGDFARTLERDLSAARAELATARAEMRRHLPILEYAESLPPIWSNATSGTGIATLNAYRKAAGMDATAGEVKA